MLHGADPAAALRAARERAALVDRSDFARLRGDGPDLLPLLNRLGTGALGTLDVGAGRQTVLTTNKGRIVARLFVYRVAEGDVLLVGGPGGAASALALRAHIDRYTIVERTGLRDASAEAALFAVSGPRADAALAATGLSLPEPGGCRAATLAGVELTLLAGDGLTPAGWSVLVAPDDAAAAWSAVEVALREVGGCAVDREVAEAARILAGTPLGGHELTEAYNPLEAGLWDAVAFDKGCYVGQEVVARLRTYDKVSRQLVRLEIDADAPPTTPQPLVVDGATAGALCSSAAVPGTSRVVGLGYLKKRVVAPRLAVRIGERADGPTARLLDDTER